MKKQEYKLVKGTFDLDEAREVLMSLINSKINFHAKKNLSSRERFGTIDQDSEKRIEELNISREQILQLLKHADETKQKITIESSINLEII